MTRENLIQAIYDNEENWSCAYSCSHSMEEENPKDVCWKCAENLLSEYEQHIKAEVIDNFQEWLKTQIVGIDNQSKEILVVDGEKWELAINKYKEHLKDSK